MGSVRFDYSDHVVLVTGGTKGAGRGIAERFAAAGATVVVCARSQGPQALPAGWDFVAADLRDGEQAFAMVDEVVTRHGRIDVLINNAGGAPPADTSTVPHRFSERIVALNLLAPIYVAQRTNHHMQAGEGGAIVNIGSVTALRPAPTAAAYGAAKAGLANYTQTVAYEWAPKVRVNCVTAGMIGSDDTHIHYGGPDSVARIEATIPVRRMATPDDIADTCMYLASDAARYVTGANLLVHGGGEGPAFLAALRK